MADEEAAPTTTTTAEASTPEAGAGTTDDTVSDEVAAMFDLSKKKKKKKKKKDAPQSEGTVTAESTPSGDAGTISPAAAGEKETHAGDDKGAALEGEEDASFLALDDAGVDEGGNTIDGTPSSAADDDDGGEEKEKEKKKKVAPKRQYANYSYQQLLDRVVSILQENNPELSEKRRHTMKPPQLMRVGTKKTLWVNFQEICKMMRRNPEHVFQFFMAELGTEGSIDGTQRLVIRGKYVPKYIESLLRKYIVEYVTCQMCRSPNTTLTRDSVSRLYFIHCQDCGSSRSVAPIRAGFHATSRADRRAARK